MSVSRRARLSAIAAAAASGALVAAMAGAALTAGPRHAVGCAGVDVRVDPCATTPVGHPGDTRDPDEDIPVTTPATPTGDGLDSEDREVAAYPATTSWPAPGR